MEKDADEQVDDLLGSLTAEQADKPTGSTEHSLLKLQVEALSGRLAEEFAARQQLEERVEQQALERFEHLRDAAQKIERLEHALAERTAALVHVAGRLCDNCVPAK